MWEENVLVQVINITGIVVVVLVVVGTNAIGLILLKIVCQAAFPTLNGIFYEMLVIIKHS